MRSIGKTKTFAAGDKSRSNVLQVCPSQPRAAVHWARAFVASLVILLTGTVAAATQEKPIEIGVLALGPRYMPAWQCGQANYQVASVQSRTDTTPVYVHGLLDGLRKLKYVEDRPENAGTPGRRFVLHVRTGTLQQLRGHAREFAAKPVDMIVAVATAAVRVASDETKGRNIPILMTGVSDPVKYGVVQSLARPGGVITGVSHQLVQGSAKRVELFKEILPGLRELITIRTPGYTPSERSMDEIRDAAGRLNIEVLDWTAKNRADVQALMEKVRHDPARGIMVMPDSLIIANLDLMLETSLAQRVPAFGIMEYMANWGAVAASGPSAFTAGSRVAGYVDKIVKGAKPGDLPVEPVDPEFVVNMKAAQCHGITVPLDVLSQADRVIR